VKKLKNQSYNYICFEIARLRTRYNNETDDKVKVSIAKRYGEVVGEFNKRTNNWFWKEHELDRIIKAVEDFKKAEDWCSEAGGNWITHKGKHICVEIRDESKIPEKIRERVTEDNRKYKKDWYVKRWRRKKELVERYANRFDDEGDKARVRMALKRFKVEDLETVKVYPMNEQKYRRTFNSAPGGGGALYVPRRNTILLDPDAPNQREVYHEMGHHIYYQKWARGPTRGVSQNLKICFMRNRKLEILLSVIWEILMLMKTKKNLQQ